MANEKNMQDNEKALKLLKSTFELYEKNKKEMVETNKKRLKPDGTRMYSDEKIQETLDILNTSQKDIVAQYVMCGGKEEDLYSQAENIEVVKKDDNDLDVLLEVMSESNKASTIPMGTVTHKEEEIEQQIPYKRENKTDNVLYDVIPLPSKGEGYADKTSKVSVAFLTAYDENMITSPNLYRDNLILDYILQAKLLSKGIDPMDLLEGDREAILLFLRGSAYGPEYPITVTDDVTGIEFNTNINLNDIKPKEFNLKGDSHGWFPFTLPSGTEVKFRFPTHRDTVTLEKVEKIENKKMLKGSLLRQTDNLYKYLEQEERTEVKAKINRHISEIEKWAQEIDDKDSLPYSRAITNKLNLLIMEVDGITDKKMIADFIKKMPISDSTALRRYMTENEPGMNYLLTIEKPESLGGGSIQTFLQFDQFLFLNIPN